MEIGNHRHNITDRLEAQTLKYSDPDKISDSNLTHKLPARSIGVFWGAATEQLSSQQTKAPWWCHVHHQGHWGATCHSFKLPLKCYEKLDPIGHVRCPHVLGCEQPTIHHHHGGSVDVMWAVIIQIFINIYYISSNPLNMSEECCVVKSIHPTYTNKIHQPLFIKDITLI